jgi:hypothetical protein
MGQEAVNGTAAAWVDLKAVAMHCPPVDHAGVCIALGCFFIPFAGSLERVIDLHQRGQLTNNGKPSALEDLERSDAAMALDAKMSELGVVDQDESFKDLEDGAVAAPASHRPTAKNWQGGVRCRDVIFSYRWVGQVGGWAGGWVSWDQEASIGRNLGAAGVPKSPQLVGIEYPASCCILCRMPRALRSSWAPAPQQG